MKVLGAGAFVRYLMYWAVRLFGQLAWYRNQADRADGYNRVLSILSIKATATTERRGQYVQLARHIFGLTGR